MQQYEAKQAETTSTPRVLNKKHLRGPVENAVYIGRPSIWGNPFVIGKDGTRDEVIAKYDTWITQKPHLLQRLGELRGKHLVCFCSPARCHGDVLLRLANRTPLLADDARESASGAERNGRAEAHQQPAAAVFRTTELDAVMSALRPDAASSRAPWEPPAGQFGARLKSFEANFRTGRDDIASRDADKAEPAAGHLSTLESAAHRKPPRAPSP